MVDTSFVIGKEHRLVEIYFAKLSQVSIYMPCAHID